MTNAALIIFLIGAVLVTYALLCGGARLDQHQRENDLLIDLQRAEARRKKRMSR